MVPQGVVGNNPNMQQPNLMQSLTQQRQQPGMNNPQQQQQGQPGGPGQMQNRGPMQGNMMGGMMNPMGGGVGPQGQMQIPQQGKIKKTNKTKAHFISLFTSYQECR